MTTPLNYIYYENDKIVIFTLKTLPIELIFC